MDPSSGTLSFVSTHFTAEWGNHMIEAITNQGRTSSGGHAELASLAAALVPQQRGHGVGFTAWPIRPFQGTILLWASPNWELDPDDRFSLEPASSLAMAEFGLEGLRIRAAAAGWLRKRASVPPIWKRSCRDRPVPSWLQGGIHRFKSFALAALAAGSFSRERLGFKWTSKGEIGGVIERGRGRFSAS